MSTEAQRRPLALIAAMTPSRVIGRDGGIPWHHPEDMKHFVRVTKGHTVIMGRKTHESIGKALPGRRNIVVTRDAERSFEGCESASDLASAIAMARETDEQPIIIGGARIYADALADATTLYLTMLKEEHDGDAHFPPIDESVWKESERRETDALTFVTLVRR